MCTWWRATLNVGLLPTIVVVVSSGALRALGDQLTPKVGSTRASRQEDLQPMSLQELSSEWLPNSEGRDFPDISNFWGSAGVARDAVGPARNSMPPFACTASDFPGGEPWLRVDGHAPEVTHIRWTAYEASRRSVANLTGTFKYACLPACKPATG